jgi:glycosyltransferase involved in cell wall biosynthesis
MLRPDARSIGYVSAAAQFPAEVRRNLDMELAEIGKFDRVWSIAERESKVISEFDASIQIDTIIPNIPLAPGQYERKEYALLPVGPNVFNTYSLLKFTQGIAPLIVFPDNAMILITGRLWRHLQFDCPQRVEYLGMVDNYQKVLGSARFVIVPTATGTGQQIKIFEALAYGVPVVCFRAAVPGLMDSYATGVVCVDTDEEFAEAVGRMWRDQSFYQQLLSGAKEYSIRPRDNSYAQSVNQLLAELS